MQEPFVLSASLEIIIYKSHAVVITAGTVSDEVVQ